jgi:hypothetical protein
LTGIIEVPSGTSKLYREAEVSLSSPRVSGFQKGRSMNCFFEEWLKTFAVLMFVPPGLAFLAQEVLPDIVFWQGRFWKRDKDGCLRGLFDYRAAKRTVHPEQRERPLD